MSVIIKIMAAFKQYDEKNVACSDKKVNNPPNAYAKTVLFCEQKHFCLTYYDYSLHKRL